MLIVLNNHRDRVRGEMRCRATFAVWSHLCKASVTRFCKDTWKTAGGGCRQGEELGSGGQWRFTGHLLVVFEFAAHMQFTFEK